MRMRSSRSWRGASRTGSATIFSCCEGFAADGDLARLDEAPQRAVRGRLRELAGPDRAPGSRGSGAARGAPTPSQSRLDSIQRSAAAGDPRDLPALRPDGDVGRAAVAVPGGADAARAADRQSAASARHAGAAPAGVASAPCSLLDRLLRARARWRRPIPSCVTAWTRPTPTSSPSWRITTSPTSSARWEAVKPGIVRRWHGELRAVGHRLCAPGTSSRAARLARVRTHPFRALGVSRRQAAHRVLQQLRRQPRELHGRLHQQGGVRAQRRLQQRHRLSEDQLARAGRLRDERKFKEYLRRHQLPTQVWYKAYPGLTAVDLERNARIRQGLESSSMSDAEAREWVALL